MTATAASIIVAVLSAVVAVVSLIFGYRNQNRLEQFRHQLQREQEEERRARDARELVARYRGPLLRTAFDLQSRLYNMLGPNGFRGDGGDYYRLSTLFVIADFLGWLEIIRRDMQFLDIGAEDQTRDLNKRIADVEDWLATTTRIADGYFLFRGQQRAIGELMTMRTDASKDRPGPRYETIGFAEFHRKMGDPDFARWFDRLGQELEVLPPAGSVRLRQVQHALIDLIDLLDPDRQWYSENRERL